MLTLGRNLGEYLVIDDNIVIQVISTDGKLRLAIDAPREVSIVRGEVYELGNPKPKCLNQNSKKSDK
jgi:carbon storage regulator